MNASGLRHLVLVLGDQLDPQSTAFDGFDPAQDAVWMAEVSAESTHVRSHQARTVVFLSAMRHFCGALRRHGITVHYRQLDDPINAGTLDKELTHAIQSLAPDRLIVVEPGEWRVATSLRRAAEASSIPLEIRPDAHFLCSRAQFQEHAEGRPRLIMEFFYREMRRRTGILMDNNQPAGGAWNFDAANRGHFEKQGPGLVPRPAAFLPDGITQEVIQVVRRLFPTHPGNLDKFNWAVTPEDAQAVLEDFIVNRLPDFGAYQDAMWSGEAFLYHSRLSSALNLKLLNPRVVLAAAEKAYREGRAPLEAVEGFVRQILGWREYVRGIYWRFMPRYLSLNALEAQHPLPDFYWTGETDMNCLRQSLGQTLELGYAHHIQRLMVIGLFALLLGVRPQEVHTWYLAVYVDAIEWVELPNVLGMSQFGDGGVMASKPYVATGKYIERMSDYCCGCRYDPGERVGPAACPFTTLYWDFLARHQQLLSNNERMRMQLKNLARLGDEELRAIQDQARRIKDAFGRKP